MQDLMLSRRVVLVSAVAALVAHVATLYALGDSARGALVSDSIQFLLGVLATLACAQAARTSFAYAAKVWWLGALALALYTVGQAFILYCNHVLHEPVFSACVGDEFLFFWIVPLAMAALLDRTSGPNKWDWALALDFCQVLLVALALHIAAFALSASWQSQGRELAYLEWWVRMARDATVLAVVWSKVALSTSPQTRSLFRRLGFFFLAYSLADGVYLYAEAAWQNYVGTFLDLLWSIPRVVLIAGAATWQDQPEPAAEERPKRSRRQTLPLHLASILGPVMVVMVALRITSSAPVTAGMLVALSFLCASIRFLITQDRQDRAVVELRASRDLLEAIVEGTTEAIYVRDLEGRYIFANRAAKKFLDSSASRNVTGSSNSDFLSAKSAEQSRRTDLEVIESGNPKSLEDAIEVGSDTHMFLSRKAPYRDSRGNIAGVLGIAVDVTERRKMEEELRKAQRMESIGTLAGGVAHDFNNLLTVIKGYSQLLLEELNGTPAHDKLQQIESAAEKAATLTRQLLAFSRQQVLQPRIINLNHIVRDMEKMLRRVIGEDIDFSVVAADGLHSILADPGQIEQVIMNLAANARDAMPRGGKFTIETANVTLDDDHSAEMKVTAGAYVQLAVSDTGSGMDEATQARMFEPFFTTKPPGKGTGLGLSTVYGITKQSGGYIWVYSQVGRGTTFQMYFPVAQVKGKSDPGGTQAQAAPQNRGSETILVVEDEPVLSQLVETSLKRRGYQVLVASSAESAENFAQNHKGPIHLLLTDVVMPQTSGREVAKRVCELRPQTRVMWMSGYTDEAVMQHGILEPGVHFLQKPFTPSTLAEKVRQVLDGSY